MIIYHDTSYVKPSNAKWIAKGYAMEDIYSLRLQDELRQMRGEPVWCKELECYGIVKMEKVGSWANELFLVGTWHNGDAAVNFEYDIKSRGLTLYRHKPEEGAV